MSLLLLPQRSKRCVASAGNRETEGEALQRSRGVAAGSALLGEADSSDATYSAFNLLGVNKLPPILRMPAPLRRRLPIFPLLIPVLPLLSGINGFLLVEVDISIPSPDDEFDRVLFPMPL